MDRSLIYTRYILAVSSGTITEEIRSEFSAVLREGDYDKVFLELLTIAKQNRVHGMDIVSILANLELEYNGLPLYTQLGSFDDYSALLNYILSYDSDAALTSDRCTELDEIALNASNVVKYGIYFSLLRYITYSRLASKNIELLTKAMAVLDNVEPPIGSIAIRDFVSDFLSM